MNKRNKNLLILLFITLVMFLSIIITACCYEKDYSIKVSPDKLYFVGNSDDKFALSVHIKTDGEWFVSSVGPYVSVYPRNGKNSILNVWMEPNNHISPRQSIIEIQSFEEPENIAFISVYQDGNPIF